MDYPNNKPTIKKRLLNYFLISSLFIIGSCDLFNGSSEDNTASFDTENMLIPASEIVDGGPGKDGIPSIDNPDFEPLGAVNYIPDDRLVIGVRIDDEIRAYPHQILDWHEIINDRIGDKSIALVHCPLTGTGMCWNREIGGEVTEFGVSGLLFRNNLIAYDRNSDSLWPQMQLRSAQGELKGQNIETFQVIETTWATWKTLYPESLVHTRNTGFNRNYGGYTYGQNYLVDHNFILFPITNRDDRLRNKVRVHGIIDSDTGDFNADVKVYEINKFGNGINIIEDHVGDNDYLIVGSSEFNFAAAFLLDPVNSSSALQFEAVQDQLPVVMQDNDGNLWDIFGYAVEGPREGEQLTSARSYNGYWFAWADFFPDLDIYEGNQE